MKVTWFVIGWCAHGLIASPLEPNSLWYVAALALIALSAFARRWRNA